MTVSVFMSVINKVASWAKATSVSSGTEHTHTQFVKLKANSRDTTAPLRTRCAVRFWSFFTQTDYSKPQQFITRHWANIYILQSGLFYIIIYTWYVWMNFNDLNSLILWWWHLRTEPRTVHDDVLVILVHLRSLHLLLFYEIVMLLLRKLYI